MDAPLGVDDGLLVVHPHRARLLRITHDMTDLLTVGHIEVEIGLHAAQMSVGRHRVPYRARLELSDTHLQLTGAHAGDPVDDDLMDDTVVALGGAARLDVVGMLEVDLHGRITDVSAGRIHVELSGLLRVFARHGDVLGTLADIESLLEAEVEALAVDGDGTLATDIDDAELAVVEEVTAVRALGGIDIERRNGRQPERCRHRLGAPDEEPVKHRVGPVDLTRCKDLLDEKLAAHALRVVVLGVHGVAGIPHIIIGVAVLRFHLITFPAALRGGSHGSKGHCQSQKYLLHIHNL